MFSLKSLLSASLAASSLILSACGSKDGFAVISNIHFQDTQGITYVAVNCDIKSTCTVNNESIDFSSLKDYAGIDFSSFREMNAKLQRNGKVNGPDMESMSEDGFDSTWYEYNMGDSSFVVIEGDYDNQNTMKMAVAVGLNTGSRPKKNVTYTGEVVAMYVSDSDGFDTGDVEYGNFHATFDFWKNTIDIGIQFDDWGWFFESVEVNPDGSFTDGSKVIGNFFGNYHAEIAGTSDLPDENVVVSFGGTKD